MADGDPTVDELVLAGDGGRPVQPCNGVVTSSVMAGAVLPNARLIPIGSIATWPLTMVDNFTGGSLAFVIRSAIAIRELPSAADAVMRGRHPCHLALATGPLRHVWMAPGLQEKFAV